VLPHVSVPTNVLSIAMVGRLSGKHFSLNCGMNKQTASLFTIRLSLSLSGIES